jgi:TIR domain-containing protein
LPIVPGFQYDLFVSYAHQNDRPWGWVSDFIRTLKEELESRSRYFRLWWDPQLRTGDDFNLAIGNAISESAVFLCVLTQAYRDSTYCKREVEEFRQQRHPAFGLTVGTLSRMQGIVLEKDLQKEHWPPELRSTSPCPFYSDFVPLFSRPSVLDSSNPWIQSLWKVRDSIWAILEEMQCRRTRGTAVERSYEVSGSDTASPPTACLAEVTDDLYPRRESLRTSLAQANDFRVSLWSDPTSPPSSDWATLSVHMFGVYPGRPATDADLPLSRLQLEATVKANPARRPLVWLARDLDITQAQTDSHKEFLDSLLNRSNIELLRIDFEDLKDEVEKRMKQSASSPLNKMRKTREDPIVHIWHRTEDPASLVPLKQYLQQKNCGISVFDYSTAQPAKLQSRLAICDGLVVPYSSATRTWAEDVMTEAFRSRRREERPFAFAAVELPPPSNEQFNFEHPRVVPIHGTPAGSFQDIDLFLSKLEQ